MPITSAIPTTAKLAFLKGELQAGHTYKCGLFKQTTGRTYNATTNTASYNDIIAATTDEVANGSGYTTGGVTVTISSSSSGTTAWIDFTDAVWNSATFSADGCFVYNDTDTVGPDRVLFVIDFGGTKSVTSGTFTVQWPTPDASNAILRLT